MSKVEITSKKWRLNAKDFLRGLIMAIGSAALMALQLALDSGTIEPKLVLKAAAAGGAIYLLKNLVQPAQKKQDITPEEADSLKATNGTAAK